MSLKEITFSDIIYHIYKKYYDVSYHDNTLSDYWEKKSKTAEVSLKIVGDNISISKQHFQLGSYEKRSIYNLVSHIPLKIQLGSLINKFEIESKILNEGYKIAKENNIFFGYDQLKQVLCFNEINKKNLINPNGYICIIGDGYGFTSSLIKRIYPEIPIICINLGKMLLFDLIGFKNNINITSYTPILGDKEDHLKKINKKGVYFVEASNAKIIKNLPIGLFINICSMQEMTMEIIKNYFSLMRTSIIDSYFYCCNRVEKSWKNGDVIRFNNYPWIDNDKIILDEICPWLIKRPISIKEAILRRKLSKQKPPIKNIFRFNHKFYPHQHRIIKISKENI